MNRTPSASAWRQQGGIGTRTEIQRTERPAHALHGHDLFAPRGVWLPSRLEEIERSLTSIELEWRDPIEDTSSGTPETGEDERPDSHHCGIEIV